MTICINAERVSVCVEPAHCILSVKYYQCVLIWVSSITSVCVLACGCVCARAHAHVLMGVSRGCVLIVFWLYIKCLSVSVCVSLNVECVYERIGPVWICGKVCIYTCPW